MSKIKVFHVITHFDLGGAERVAINICNSKSRKFDYHIIEVVRGNSGFSSELINELKKSEINYHRSRISNKKTGIFLFPFFLLYKFIVLKPRIIHSHTEIPDLAVYLFAKLTSFLKLNVRYVRTIHNTLLWDEWKFIGKKVEKFFIKYNCSVAISQSTKMNYENEFKVKDIPMIYNGVKKQEQKQFNNIVLDKVNVLFAGRLEFQKGVDVLIEIIKNVGDNNKYHFHIVGEGSLEDVINRDLSNLRNVTIYSKVYNLSQFLSSFDFLLMPSNFEGLGLLSVEASMSGLPSIINNCIGLNETLPEKWPLKINRNSVEGYVDVFENKLFNIDFSILMKECLEYVESKFSVEVMQKKYEKLYLNKIAKYD